MPNPVFDKDTPIVDDTPDTSDITAEILVGEGRKYKTADDLAKAYANADAKIAADKEALATKEAENKVLKDLLEANQNKPNDAPGDKLPVNKDDSRDTNNQVPVDQNRQQNDDTDLPTRIREELTKAQEEREFGTNVDKVATQLKDHFGSEAKANQYIRDKAKELNVPIDWMMDVAGRSPAAFFNTVGFANTAPGNSQATPNSSTSDVSTAAFRNTSGGARNNAHYEKIRKENPKLYYSTEVQKNLMIDARKQGPDFFNN